MGTSKDSEISPQLTNNPRAMIISNPSAEVNRAGQNIPHVLAGEGMQTGGLSQRPEAISINFMKLEDDLKELGQKIKHHEDNVNYLKTQIIKLEESVMDRTATIEKYYKTSFTGTQNQDLDLSKTEEETLGDILKHEKSAAALLCMIRQPESQVSDHPLLKDVLGIVTSLGKVDDDNLSRLLSEYLGLETMLAVVCKTDEGVKALEAYNKEGLINKSLGLHELADSIGRSLDDPFHVICLESLRPYPGEFIADDPQRRLDILKPRVVSGETPPGFLGFAVNMINIGRTHLYYTRSGFGLRETLFYNLLSRLQVYKSREDMLKAVPYIPDGAISLDGGMIRSPGRFRLGHPRNNVKFPIGFERLSIPREKYLEIENQIKETKWKKNRMVEDFQREQKYLDCAKLNYEIKKKDYLKFMAEVARASTPR